MTWVAVAIGGSAILGAVMSNNAANKAADAQRDAANSANRLQWDMYSQNREDQAPWREAGGWAVGSLKDLLANGGFKDFSMADFQADPGYQFRLQQGQQALARSAAARGGALGGGSLRALTRYSQGVASDEYGRAFDRYNANQTNRYNRLASLAGLGQTSANMTGQYGMNAANQMGANTMSLGNAMGANALYQGQNWSNAINGLGSAWYTYANRPGATGGSMYNYNPWGGQLYGNGNGGTEVVT